MDFRKMYLPVAEKAFQEEAVGFHGVYGLLGDKENMDDVADAIIKIKENADELAAWEGAQVTTPIIQRDQK